VSELSTTTQDRPARATGLILLILARLVAAFGVASCCGLPFMLVTLGLETAWLGGFPLTRRAASVIPTCRSHRLPGGLSRPPLAVG
jgi:hypothetical protein